MDDKNNPQEPQPQSEQPHDGSLQSSDSSQSLDAPESDGSSTQSSENTPSSVGEDAYQEREPAPEQASSFQAVDPYEPRESTSAIAHSGINPTNQQLSPASMPIQARTNKKRRLVIIVSAIVLFFAALAAAYFFWYQNPNKVVSDSIMHAIQAKTIQYTGTLTTTGNAKVAIDFNGANAADSGRLSAKMTFDYQDESYTLNADALIDRQRDLYFKVKDIDALVENYRSAMPAESQELLDQLIAEVDNKWIKISAAELENYSPDAAQAQKCLTDAVKKLQEDGQVKNQLAELYKKHPFIVIDETLGSKNGSLGYRLLPNKEQSTAFSKGLRETDVYQSLQKCDPSFMITDEDLSGSGDDSAPVELWVDRWAHTITKFAVSDKEDGTKVNIVFEPEFNQDITIETPSDAMTLKQLEEEVRTLLQSSTVTQES